MPGPPNHLLAAMPPQTLALWAPQMVPLDVRAGDVLHEPGVPLRHVYFPGTALVSLLHVMHDGATAQIALIGRDGVLGLSVLMGGQATSMQGVVQCAGRVLRLPADALIREFDHGGAAMDLMLRFAQALIMQVTQTAACNRHHQIQQQLCRMLLHCLDRIDGYHLDMTQEHIAQMLGVRREGVTAAAAKLQKEGVIRYSRGRIAVLRRDELERHSCECYAVVREAYARLLPPPGAPP